MSTSSANLPTTAAVTRTIGSADFTIRRSVNNAIFTTATKTVTRTSPTSCKNASSYEWAYLHCGSLPFSKLQLALLIVPAILLFLLLLATLLFALYRCLTRRRRRNNGTTAVVAPVSQMTTTTNPRQAEEGTATTTRVN
jgi:hypothetical protein